MLHLIWSDESSDENKGIKTHLIQCFIDLYLKTSKSNDDDSSVIEVKGNKKEIVKNLIELTFNSNLSDLISIEKIIDIICNHNDFGHYLNQDIVDKLTSIYSYRKKPIPELQRRGAICILSMIMRAQPTKNNSWASKNWINFVDVNLEFGLEDLELFRYSCTALQTLGRNKSESTPSICLSIDHPVCQRFTSLILSSNLDNSPNWYFIKY